MAADFAKFDEVRGLVRSALDSVTTRPLGIGDLYFIRDLHGKVRIAVADNGRWSDHEDTLEALASELESRLGSHGYPADQAVIFVGPELLETLRATRRRIGEDAFFVERLITGNSWGTLLETHQATNPSRWTLYSVKGGVGRSTTAVVLAEHLARRGHRVLVLDLDLESPGLPPALVTGEPEFGIVDWFVEDLVGQGDQVLDRMVGHPSWTAELDGRMLLAPAHGHDPGNYVAKLGRVWVSGREGWGRRLLTLVSTLEARHEPRFVIIESRSGLHDFAASAVSDLGAGVLLFGMDSPSHWNLYEVLFRHWARYGAVAGLRERLQVVAGLVPEIGKDDYIQKFRERCWDLFCEHLYDRIADGAGDGFSFDLVTAGSPHDPIPVHWNRGLAAGASLGSLDGVSVRQAYTDFLSRFDQLIADDPDDRS